MSRLWPRPRAPTDRSAAEDRAAFVSDAYLRRAETAAEFLGSLDTLAARAPVAAGVVAERVYGSNLLSSALYHCVVEGLREEVELPLTLIRPHDRIEDGCAEYLEMYTVVTLQDEGWTARKPGDPGDPITREYVDGPWVTIAGLVRELSAILRPPSGRLPAPVLED